jgi:hypothetical protein
MVQSLPQFRIAPEVERAEKWPTRHPSNLLAKPTRFAHGEREWYRSTSLYPR